MPRIFKIKSRKKNMWIRDFIFSWHDWDKILIYSDIFKFQINIFSPIILIIFFIKKNNSLNELFNFKINRKKKKTNDIPTLVQQIILKFDKIETKKKMLINFYLYLWYIAFCITVE